MLDQAKEYAEVPIGQATIKVHVRLKISKRAMVGGGDSYEAA
jgi:hypothetical protein